METDELGTVLKQAAAQWDTPTFEVAAIVGQSGARRRRRRRRLIGSCVAACAISGAIATAVVGVGDTSRPTSLVPPRTANPHCCAVMAPARVPDAHVSVLTRTGRVIDGRPVLARARTGRSITLRAVLSFGSSRPARVDAAALIVAKPGTTAGAGGGPSYDSFYNSTRIAEGQPVAATAPSRRFLSVTTPRDLQPGTYPVFSVMQTGLIPGEEQGIAGPFNVSSELGVIVVTS
jgi:hypothetical protein